MSPYHFSSRKSGKGFTLIEILVVIGLIVILAAIVLIAINPARQFAQGRDALRTSNLTAILNAIGQRMADNKGIFAGTFTIDSTTYTCGLLPASTTDISTAMAPSATTTSGSLGCLVPTYIPMLPADPTAATASTTGYYVFVESSGRVHVLAPATEPSIPRTTSIELVR